MSKKVLCTFGLLLFAVLLPVQGQALHDPTQPLGWNRLKPISRVTDKKEKYFILQSVLVGKERKNAMINGHFVSEGAWVNGSKVIKIRENSVLLRTKGKEWRLYLKRAHGVKKIFIQRGRR